MNKKFSGITTVILCLTVVLAVFAGCSADIKDDDTAVYSFTDALGRKVSLYEKPERVAAMLGSFAEVWTLSGGSLCAAAEDAWDDFGLELEDAVNIGGAHSPNLELLLAAKPDFVIASSSTSSNVELCQILEAADIQIAYFDVDNFEDYLKMLDICTDITGEKQLYEENGIAVKSRIEAVKAEIEASELSGHERSVLLLRASSGFVKAKNSEGTILGEMLADLGCINIADSDMNLLENISIESIIRHAPYHIFVVTMGDDTEKAMDNLNVMMEENPAWGTLEAVSEGRVHLMERRLFNIKPNARWAESYEILSSILLQK